MKAFVILLVCLGLIVVVFVVLILLVAFRMDTDPAFHGYVPGHGLW
jgi:hypothetical protein